MMFMNEYDIEDAARRVDVTETPNLACAILILARLANWTNSNSDGWAYWPLPTRAARSLMTLIQGVDRYSPTDVTEAQVRKATTPIKSFFTRQGKSYADIIETPTR